MKFNSLIEKAGSETDYSQLFIHYHSSTQSLAMMVRLVEELGGDIITIEIILSDEPDHKIACFKLGNEAIQNMVIGLSENGIYEVQGISRRLPDDRGQSVSIPTIFS